MIYFSYWLFIISLTEDESNSEGEEPETQTGAEVDSIPLPKDIEAANRAAKRDSHVRPWDKGKKKISKRLRKVYLGVLTSDCLLLCYSDARWLEWSPAKWKKTRICTTQLLLN